MPLGGAGVITGVSKFRVRPVTRPGTPIENFRNRLFIEKLLDGIHVVLL
jgi:hypothetical protein